MTKQKQMTDPTRSIRATVAHVRRVERNRRAEAYPMLVEALRDAAVFMESRTPGAGFAIKNLLRELGEE